MYAESEDIGYQFEYDPERDFRIYKCQVCKHYSYCPIKWQCKEMKKFIQDEAKYVKNLDYDYTNNGDL